MAPDWSRAVRPVVLVYTAISIAITIGFNADVNAQAGAYATGILAMMASGAVAVTISAIRKRQRAASVGFTVLTVVMLYALAANVTEKPDGITISAFLILGILVISLASRVTRTTELRVERIEFDGAARQFITDPSEFSEVLRVRGVDVAGHRVLRAQSPAAPNAIAAILLALRDCTGVRPHAYFEWSEGNPIAHLMRYLFLGRGTPLPSSARLSAKMKRTRKNAPASTSDDWTQQRASKVVGSPPGSPICGLPLRQGLWR